MDWLRMWNEIVIALVPLIIFGILKWATHLVNQKVNQLSKEFEEHRKEIATHGEGIQCLLRNSLMEKMKQAGINGYADEHTREDVEDMYNSYIKLHGNGMIKGMYREFVKLPFPKEK